jgi:hypothetical protein
MSHSGPSHPDEPWRGRSTRSSGMSAPPIANPLGSLREAAVRAAWTQWGAIFTFAASPRPAHAIVDPEALLLASLGLTEQEPRLRRVLDVWAQYGARLLSVQRTKISPGGILRPFAKGSSSLRHVRSRRAMRGGGRSLANRGRGMRPRGARRRRRRCSTVDPPSCCGSGSVWEWGSSRM